jgi:SAM-dependent methyltransferase
MTISTASPARAYEEYFVPAMFAPLSEHVLAAAALQPGEHVLDLACGTGIVARQAAAQVGPTGRVLAVDISPMMLEEGRSHPVPDGVEIEWRQADGVTADLPVGAFDVAICQQGLQFFPDRAAGAGQLHRAVRDGGRAVVATWLGLEDNPFIARAVEAELRHLDALGAGVDRADAERPFSLGKDELRELLDGAGFPSVDIRTVAVEARFPTPDHFVERMQRAYAAVVPAFAEDPDAFDRYVAAVTEATRDLVEEHRQGDHVVIPFRSNLAVARESA